VKLFLLSERLAIARFAHDAPRPAEPPLERFFSVTRTADELSVVAAEEFLPRADRIERGWRCFKAEGPFEFSATGILASLLTPLAVAKISIFAISTYDTDYLLVKENDLASATAVLEKAGHIVVNNDPR
jgi:uncharacterized protein